jgi:tRNA nucleotidyltransferase (CCA-adding enzyme)
MMKGSIPDLRHACLVLINSFIPGPDPLRAIQLINDLFLHPSLFSMPSSIVSSFSSPPAHFSTSIAAATILHTLLYSPTSPPLPPIHPTLLTSLHSSPSLTARLFLAAALTLYRGITYSDAKNKKHPAVEAAIREGLKIGTQNHYLDGIPPLFAAADLLREPSLEKFKGPMERVTIG